MRGSATAVAPRLGVRQPLPGPGSRWGQADRANRPTVTAASRDQRASTTDFQPRSPGSRRASSTANSPPITGGVNSSGPCRSPAGSPVDPAGGPARSGRPWPPRSARPSPPSMLQIWRAVVAFADTCNERGAFLGGIAPMSDSTRDNEGVAIGYRPSFSQSASGASFAIARQPSDPTNVGSSPTITLPPPTFSRGALDPRSRLRMSEPPPRKG